MFIGIDLGTSNSSLAVFDGDSVVMVPSSLGENLTPSVVRIDARGAIVTGRRAYGFLESDPANTWGEFKRLMGTGERLAFAAAGLNRSDSTGCKTGRGVEFSRCPSG